MKQQEDNTLDTQNQQNFSSGKLLIVFAFLAIGFLLIIVRLVYLQIINYDEFRSLSKEQHETYVNLKAERGNIYDRNGRLLATTIRSHSYAIDPLILKDTSEIIHICNLVSIATGTDSETLINKVTNTKGAFVWLARGLVYPKNTMLDSINTRGFIKLREPKRNYLYGNIGAQVVGSTDIDNNGLTGIELSYDSLLKGVPGKILMLKDRAGRKIPTPYKPLMDAISGKSIYLTIDIELQRIVEYELKNGVERANAESGSVVVLNPKTGEILAMASSPGFDPNNPQSAQSSDMRNRIISDIYEPGSTFKLVIAAVGIQEKLITPNHKVNGHNGFVQYEDYSIRDENKLGYVKFHEAFEQSSNIVFSDISYNIPANILYKYIRDFNFGLNYGIGLHGEASGKTKNPGQLNAVARRFHGFGYGISVSSLQMANAYAAVANNGVLMKPMIIKEIRDTENDIYSKNEPVKIRSIISKKSASIITNLLVGVVNQGTGKAAQVPGLNIAGKTGTAQQILDSSYSKINYTASFAGYFPAENPAIAMLIVLDKPKTNIYGGATAAPIFRNIAKSWISASREMLFHIEKSKEIADTEKTIRMPDLSGMAVNDAIRLLNSLGFNLKLKSDNFIIKSHYPSKNQIISLKQPDSIKFYAYKNNEISKQATGLNLVGLPLNKAIAILASHNIKPKVRGSGKVKQITLIKDGNGKTSYLLICE